MKKIVLFLGLISLVFISNFTMAQTVDVTIYVDMQNETVSPNGVHIAGNFQGWDPAATLMTPPAFGAIYEITIQATTGDQLLYKFINGDTWTAPEPELVPSVCGVDDGNGGFNRVFDVPTGNTNLEVVCFGECLPCILPPIDITFQVDMSNETVAGNVYVAGTFNGWNTTATPLIDQGNGVYAVTVTLGEGETVEFKYLNGSDYESLPGTCTMNGNRFYTVTSSNETLPLVCFGSCDPCTTVVDVNVTFQVDMSEQTVVPEGVHIAGNFQGWDPAGTPMIDQGNGIWAYSIILQSGSFIEYKFINGNAWGTPGVAQEIVPEACASNSNRFITLPINDISIPAVCYGSCVICEPPLFDVTFSVDMSTQIVSDSGVHLGGSFQGWNAGSIEMAHVGSKVYEVTLPIGEGQLHEYKFVNGNDWMQAENSIPGECSNFEGNRVLLGPSSVTILPTVCFDECGECTTTLYTFNLSVMLEGAFNGTYMNTNLFDDEIIPLDQPYNVPPWNYPGTEVLSALPEAEIVDWIYIQMRETDGDASTATPDKLLDHQAAVVLANGTIARPDGIPAIYFNGNISDNIYLVVYHRNHLAIMSATALVGFADVFSYDFTNNLSKAYLDGQKSLGTGVFGMIAGDSDANGTINMDDKDVNWKNEAGNAGYYPSDLDMDSQVNNPDKNEIWEPNFNSVTKVPN